MIGYVIIPGYGGSGAEHWQSLWQHGWGSAAVRIAPQSWNQPDRVNWVRAIERAVTHVEAQAQEVVLIAHSLGCLAASEWAQTAVPGRIAAAFFVAPADPESPAFPREDAASFCAVTPAELSCPSVLVASADDPYCTVSAAEDFAARWGSELRVLGAQGHLNAQSGLGEWSQGREILDSVLPR